jgi:hypothetical protein
LIFNAKRLIAKVLVANAKVVNAFEKKAGLSAPFLFVDSRDFQGEDALRALARP